MHSQVQLLFKGNNCICYIAGVLPATARIFIVISHERATLRKLWRQTGNSSLFLTNCWPLLQVIRDGLMLSLESQRVFKICFCFDPVLAGKILQTFNYFDEAYTVRLHCLFCCITGHFPHIFASSGKVCFKVNGYYITNHLMTGLLGNSVLCFPRISMFPTTSSLETLRNSLFPSGPAIKC